MFQPGDWEIETFDAVICICGVPSTENLVQCIGENCPIVWYHQHCAGGECTVDGTADAGGSASRASAGPGAGRVTDEWRCDFCAGSPPSESESGEMENLNTKASRESKSVLYICPHPPPPKVKESTVEILNLNLELDSCLET